MKMPGFCWSRKGWLLKSGRENSDTAIKGNVIRFQPPGGEGGRERQPLCEQGLTERGGPCAQPAGQTPTSADALLAGAGLLTGNVTVEASDTVEEGLIISQSELPGTILPQALRWIMW